MSRDEAYVDLDALCEMLSMHACCPRLSDTSLTAMYSHVSSSSVECSWPDGDSGSSISTDASPLASDATEEMPLDHPELKLVVVEFTTHEPQVSIPIRASTVVQPGRVLAPVKLEPSVLVPSETRLVLAVPKCEEEEEEEEHEDDQTGETGSWLLKQGAQRGGSSKPQFKDEAMRVLYECEQMLLQGKGGALSNRDRVLKDIAQLKRRYSRSTSASAPSRSSIMRQRRYSLGIDARRVLKTWVEDHLEDPYPSVQDKQQLGAATQLTMKQINDWFTNYRKRHWADEMDSMMAVHDDEQ